MLPPRLSRCCAQRLSASWKIAEYRRFQLLGGSRVLNAFRRHGKSRSGAVGTDAQYVGCSTPFGVMENRGRPLQSRRLSAECAQRLSASWKIAATFLPSWPIPAICAQRLSASWKIAGKRNLANAFPGSCSTPFGIVEDRGRFFWWTVAGKVERSTPFGIVEDRGKAGNLGLGATMACSTPFGIVEDRGWQTTRSRLTATGAQRLSASWKIADAGIGHIGQILLVLNAFRHRGRSRDTAAITDDPSFTCSTPFGIVENRG